MRASAKIGLVLAGYAGALLLAWAVVALYIAATNTPDRQASSGMYAFGDSLFFLAVFGVASVPATGAALFFLRPHRLFWRVLSVAALLIAVTGLAAAVDYHASQASGAGSAFSSWSDVAVLRVLVAPLFTLGFFLSGLFAPSRPTRIALFAATLVEGAAVASVVVLWVRPFLTR
jgi:hypothetical protein